MPSRRSPAPSRHRAPGPGQWLALFTVAILAASLLVGISLGPTAGLAATMLRQAEGGVFDFPPLPDDLGEPSERSLVLARDGSVLAVLRVENRKTVELDEVPEHVQDAVLATEDADFYTHRGVNYRAIMRAALGNLRAGAVTSGASTITQQLVKNVITGDERTLRRKVREAAYAVELEKRLSKREILQTYLNEAYFANGVYGIGTAAEYYWGKDVGALTVEEGALLAGIIRSPEYNDPRDNPAAAKARRDIVLEQMMIEGFLKAAEAERLQRKPIKLDVHPLEEDRNPFFVDYVKRLLEQEPALGPDRIARQRAMLRGGLTIHTTLDPRLQDIAQRVISEVLDQGGDPLASLAAVNPESGEVVTLAFGPKPYGKGPGQTEVFPAVPGMGSGGRQAGSAFKAFQIVAALEEGISPGYSFQAGSSYTWKPPKCGRHTLGNYADASQGVLDMGTATAVSSNTYFAHLVELTGPEKLAEVAGRMGITSQIEPVCAAVLGTEEVYPLDMAAAFGTLANEGVRCTPYAISKVTDRDGRVLARNDGDCERVIERPIAARATSLLRGPIERGTASRNGRVGRPAAGKTGTTDDYRNAWFTGFVPQLSAAVWVGHEDNSEMRGVRYCPRGVTGGCVPTMIWGRFMREAIDALELPVVPFPPPPPIPTAVVPSVVGMTEQAATEVLEEAGFRPIAETVVDYRPAGTVVEQEPGGGGRAPRGGAVVISISDGEGEIPIVPALLGLTEAEALAKLAELELPARVERVPADPGQVGRVVAQLPGVGATMAGVDAVTVRIGRAREPGEEPSRSPSPSPTASPSPSPSPSQSPTEEPTETESPGDEEPTPRPARTRRPRPTEDPEP